MLSLLTVSGAVVSATAANVYAAGDAARRLPPGARVMGRIDPLTPALLVEAADTTQSAAARVKLLDALANGACLSVREMLFGATANRHAALDRVINVMSAIPDAPALRQQFHQRLDAFSAGPPRSNVTSRAVGVSDVALLRWLLPGTIEARIDYCRTVR